MSCSEYQLFLICKSMKNDPYGSTGKGHYVEQWIEMPFRVSRSMFHLDSFL